MTQTPAEGGPLLEVLGKVHLALGKLGDSVDRHTERLNATEKKQRELNANILPLRLELIPILPNGIQNRLDLSPVDGWFWDIAAVVTQGLSAGTISMYAGTPVQTGATITGVLWNTFTSTGPTTAFYGKKQFFLNSSEQIMLQGNASVPATGVSVSIYGTQVSAPYWGDYSL